jgi:circadian clock protein KaiC
LALIQLTEGLMKNAGISPLPKTRTGIAGLDEVTEGGIPMGRPTLVCGSAGCGKTLFAIQFLTEGIVRFNEPGVLMSFEETKEDLSLNVRSLGIDLNKLVTDDKLRVDHVYVNRAEIEETGEFDLEGLFIRMNHAVEAVGAKRIVFDTIESLFGGIVNEAILRSELRRLFQWVRDKRITAIITGERGEKTLTRQGLEEYISDCVILLDFRVINQVATRRLRIVKYRGSTHGTNEYPFLINEGGISVLPITSLRLDHTVSTEIISTGIAALDSLFSRGGIFRGSSILLTGSAGTAKTILAAYFALSTCNRNETALYFSFEESSDQLRRNMDSIGLDFAKHLQSGALIIHASRPSLQGLEMHLLTLNKLIEQHDPQTVIIDPISSLLEMGSAAEVSDMLIRVIDLLKVKVINALFTSLTREFIPERDQNITGISSLADIWIHVENEIHSRTRARGLRIIKARGMGHRTELQNMVITNDGLKFIDNNRKVKTQMA